MRCHSSGFRLGPRLARLERRGRAGSDNVVVAPAAAVGGATPAAGPSSASDQGVDYLAFEARFRGSEQTVRERQSVYRGRLEGRRRVVDLGCGRGELLDLMREAGVPAYGVDTEPDFVDLVAEKGIEVRREDAIAHLESLADGEVDGIVASHVVEHLPPATIGRLVGAAARVLPEGGLLILETPNPESLLAGSINFHRDPTHLRPVHPDTLAFLCESAGFSTVEVLRLSPVPEGERLPARAPGEEPLRTARRPPRRAAQRDPLRAPGLRRGRAALMRILWVVPRYGPDVVGGAETLVRALATRAAAEGWDVEVATTCASDHTTWADDLPPGTHDDAGVRVHRFPVGRRDVARHDALHATVLAGRAGYLDELEWLAHSVWSAPMQEFIDDSGHDLRILAPYLFGTTVWGAMGDPRRSALLPCLHDEPYAHLPTVRALLGAVAGCLFNSPAEERLGRRLAPIRDGGVVGVGFDPPNGSPGPPLPALADVGPYLLYVGRLEEGKRVDVAVNNAVRLASERPGAPPLALMGRGGYRPPASARGHVIELGRLSEAHKRAAVAGALALVNPSEMESLSLVLMEAWLEGTPGIVAAGSEVMADHIARSGGGMTFAAYGEFRDAVTRLLDEPGLAERQGAGGRAYVLSEYGWPAVWRRLSDTCARLAG